MAESERERKVRVDRQMWWGLAIALALGFWYEGSCRPNPECEGARRGVEQAEAQLTQEAEWLRVVQGVARGAGDIDRRLGETYDATAVREQELVHARAQTALAEAGARVARLC